MLPVFVQEMHTIATNAMAINITFFIVEILSLNIDLIKTGAKITNLALLKTVFSQKTAKNEAFCAKSGFLRINAYPFPFDFHIVIRSVTELPKVDGWYYNKKLYFCVSEKTNATYGRKQIRLPCETDRHLRFEQHHRQVLELPACAALYL